MPTHRDPLDEAVLEDAAAVARSVVELLDEGLVVLLVGLEDLDEEKQRDVHNGDGVLQRHRLAHAAAHFCNATSVVSPPPSCKCLLNVPQQSEAARFYTGNGEKLSNSQVRVPWVLLSFSPFPVSNPIATPLPVAP